MEEALQQEKQELEYKNPNEDQGNFLKYLLFFLLIFLENISTEESLVMQLFIYIQSGQL